ncbi:unnamed protein product [Urochloa decumbens]|uniref:Uncharacterized protein n=1 Tax=Urochloa decumbens TaxID=240449 RepID=A0ABC9H6Y9_9POAL
MATIAVSASTGVMNSLLSKLSILLGDKYKQLKGVRKDIEFFSRELPNMCAALEMLANVEKLDPQTKVWRDMVRETAYDIDDCIDIFMHNLGQGGDKEGLLDKISGKIRKLRAHNKLADKIQELKVRVVQQSESRDRYKITEAAGSPIVPPVDPRVQAMFEDAQRLVGIDGPRDEITQLLLEEGDNNFGIPKVLSIVGFGGLGKTTLANQVYTKIKNEFQCAAFVSISRSPDMANILKEMLSGVGYSNMNMSDDVNKLITDLIEHLAHKRYLIVIDDIWRITDWNIIRCALLQNRKDSRVITTTRIREVATACCSEFQGHVHEMQPLNNHDSRSLFFKRLFNTEVNCPKQYIEISEDMLRKCRGVPLAITSIASLLATHGMDIQKWEKIQYSMVSELETNPTLEWMRHVLSLSYNDLSYHLKTCLLYLGTYPEDHKIRRDDLVRQWIAEGFVPEKHGLDLEEVAEGYFNELINRNMIQPVDSPYTGEVLSCQVHDLMLDLILLKCTEENFISTIDGLRNIKGTSQTRRISHQNHSRNIPPAMERMSLPQVRSYMLYPAAKSVLGLSRFELLRVLHLDHGISWGPKSTFLDLSGISHLFLLRYLKVSGFRLKLPKKFGKLQHLMTLDVAMNWHLSLPSLPTCLELCNGVRKQSNLQTLRGFDIGMNSVETIRDLSELTNLRDLGLRDSGSIREQDSDIRELKHDTLAASLRMLGNNNLRTLWVDFSAPEQFWNDCFTHPHHLQSLLGLRPIKVPQVPKWMAQADRLARLHWLEVEQLRSDDAQILAHMPCLAYLQLRAKEAPEKGIVIHSNDFPVLKKFIFGCKLSCLTFESAAMPLLKELVIHFDSRAPEAKHGVSPLSGIEHLASLEEVTVRVQARRGEGSKLESLCRNSIQRHHRYQSMKIDLRYEERDDENRPVRSTSYPQASEN